MRRAAFQSTLEDGRVRCGLCPHGCVLREGQVGLCHVRAVQGGELVSLVYGLPEAVHVDPIEKKPLFHFHPGALTLSLGTVGCNLRCTFCQNHSISQTGESSLSREVTPGEVLAAARAEGLCILSFTYTEPTIFFEYLLDVARPAHQAGMANVLVTNGYLNRAPLDELLPVVDAANVDLKFSDARRYRAWTGAKLSPVLDTIRALHAAGRWVEVTTLVIPGLNDDDDDLRTLARMVRDVSPDVPWHVSRFHPMYRMQDRPATPLDTIRRARDLGLQEGLRFVYSGNVPGDGGEDTACPGCGKILIQRSGFSVLRDELVEGACTRCGAKIPGVWPKKNNRARSGF
jgi:pyruvate formate lyase activating enzyme